MLQLALIDTSIYTFHAQAPIAHISIGGSLELHQHWRILSIWLKSVRLVIHHTGLKVVMPK